MTRISNILSIASVTRKYQVVFDSKAGNLFRMVLPDREVRFQISPNRLYYFDATDCEKNVLLLNTVTENWEGFTWCEYKGSREAQWAIHLLRLLYKRYLGNMVCSNIIVNFPVTFQDVKNTKLIFGPYVNFVKRETGEAQAR